MLAHLLKVSGEQFHGAILHANCVVASVGGGSSSCAGLVDGDKRYGYAIGSIGLLGSRFDGYRIVHRSGKTISELVVWMSTLIGASPELISTLIVGPIDSVIVTLYNALRLSLPLG